MLCQEIMKTDVRWIGLDMTVEDAARMMREWNVGFLPVCDSEKTVFGVITDRDIVIRVVASGESPLQRVEGFLTDRVVSCLPTDDLFHAEQLMGQERVSRILCVDENGELQGVISLSDLAQVEDATRAATTLRNVSRREARI